MKKTAFLFGAIFFLNMVSAPSHAFDFYGCWKSDKERKTDKLICFYKNSVRVDKETYPDPIYKEKDKSFILVIPSTFANIEFSIHEDQSISTMDPQVIGGKIRYIKISEEEAESLLK